jgi:hypothetical protein
MDSDSVVGGLLPDPAPEFDHLVAVPHDALALK